MTSDERLAGGSSLCCRDLAWPGGAAGTAPAGAPASAPGGGGSAAVSGVIPDLHGQAAKRKPDDHEVIDLAIAVIDLNPHQTRSFTKAEIASLEELRDSIRVQGVIQPITVRPGKEGRYS